MIKSPAIGDPALHAGCPEKRKEKNVIACCGLECEKCEAFIATATNDDALREKTARQWSEAYHAPILPEHINCTGCLSSGVKTYHCENLCEIRKCAVGRAIVTCAECGDFPCGRLSDLFKMAPQAETNLQSLRG
jgi:hypothetical protein